ncbi:MAG TPA: EscU/YscU/HrcU family type III secretion system export apparatus switch protein [Bryobacteraceae bacterium]|nr:EscU/YscU/HrcU family type III secretion system export apparatus switch protein [Bryobacteraceae bacterium]
MADQKTEKPTKKRLLKAREEGSVPSTRQFIAGVQFCIIVTLINARGPEWLADATMSFRRELERAFTADITPAELLYCGAELTRACLLPMLLIGVALSGVGFGLHLGITKLGFAPKKLLPDPKRLNPLNRIKQLPRQNLTAAAQSLILLPVFAVAIYNLVTAGAEKLFTLPLTSVQSGMAEISGQIQGILWKAAALFMVFGCVELLRETRRHANEIKMTKQEVKDEAKETDGNPQIKARIRSIRRSQARKRMMQAVPTASAVIVNPTHFAVALKYEPGAMAAPLVVAKGKNYLALRIRSKALDHSVPLIENPPLAQALYKSVDVGQEIPSHLYRAIAEILAYIYRLTKR